MKLLLSSLLFASLCALSSWSVSSGSHVVTQSPDVSVMEGETVTISCCWTVKVERRRVTWLKNENQTDIENFLKNQSQGSLPTETSDCLNLTFTNITREDSGTYTCKVIVEIPRYITLKGNGTVITVTARDNNTKDDTGKDNHQETPNSSSPPLPMIISLAVVASLFLITLACFCTLRRRQARAARVIYEVPHIDSEEAEMDKHSTTSSRGSSQWCQVPVYESFDYFERVQTKESG